MSDAQAVATKTIRQASETIANMATKYSNIALIGPVTSVEMVEAGSATYLVVATNSKITIVPPS